jgi:phosphatidylglycerol---prolipoprotein diacylglyceryl transferase
LKNQKLTREGLIMPEGIQIGPISIHFYGVLIMLGVLAACWLSSREAIRRSQDPEVIWDSVIWLILGGIIGARIWHILTPTPSDVANGLTTSYYLAHPLDAISIWKGGLGIPGAVIGGVFSLFVYTRSHKLSFSLWLDIISPGLALAQAIGRWGNFINQEVYGAPTNLPWGIYIDPAHRLPGFEQYSTYQPLFLYESIFNLLNMAFLLWVGRRFKNFLKPGDLFLSYLVTYPTARFLLEFIRLDSSQIAGINANQTFMAIIAICALSYLVFRHLYKRDQQPIEIDSQTSDKENIQEGGN